MRAPRGFTLVELMTVIAIVGVIATLAVSITGDSATTATSSDRIASTLGYARARSLATRTIHRVQVESQTVSVWRATTTGLTTPTAWERIQIESIPTSTKVWNATTTVAINPTGGPTENAAIVFPIDFKPDGSTTGGTIYVTDRNNRKKSRVLVYRATGGTYIREGW